MVWVLKGDEKGSIEDVKEGLCVNLLRMMMNDGVEAFFEEEGQIVLRQVEGRKDFVEEGVPLFSRSGAEETESWLLGSFARFSYWLGLLTKGFEEEILHFLRRMNDKIS